MVTAGTTTTGTVTADGRVQLDVADQWAVDVALAPAGVVLAGGDRVAVLVTPALTVAVLAVLVPPA